MSDVSENVAIEFRDVTFRSATGTVILDHLGLAVRTGETFVLLGRSGSGKTTALRLINRLLDPTEGTIQVNGRATREWDPIKLRRMVGYVIQDAGLFPHYTVERNVGLVPWLEKWPADRTRARVTELLELVGLESTKFATRYPHELSGGQRQRVGVARALASNPQILLMDEPFGALDPITRGEMQREFAELQHRISKTVVFVTHDTREAMFLGTRIAFLEAGRLAGVYTPDEFLHATEPIAAAYLAAFRMANVSLS
jgi:osmoprotectant transport system ATP-binding protein